MRGFLTGVVLALGIGAFCRFAGLPLPAPPVFIGALLVVAMTLGYQTGERLFAQRPAPSRAQCGGPTGGQPYD
jgi:XapX domain-containing protein